MADGAKFCGGCGAVATTDKTSGNIGSHLAGAEIAAGLGKAATGVATAVRAAAPEMAAGLKSAAQAAAPAIRKFGDSSYGPTGNDVNYDEFVIQRFANELYQRARGIVIFYSVMGTIIGIILGLTFTRVTNSFGGSNNSGVAWFVLGAICCGIGYWIGQGKAFWLRLEAQNALCRVQIERNTRQESAA
jgi:hypothetical protein